MCARITLTTTKTEIADLFGLSYDLGVASRRRYNVAPSQTVPVVRVAGGRRELVAMRWGLVPHWAKGQKLSGYVNARAETAPEKPAFRDPFRFRRCVVPVGGFFEWRQVGKRKQPYFFRNAGGGALALAALWDSWAGPDGPVETVALLTVPANDLVEPMHDRMPAILTEDQFARWLDPRETDPRNVLPMLVPFPAERLERWPVTDRVNAVASDDPDLLQPVPEPAKPRWVQPSLFDVA